MRHNFRDLKICQSAKDIAIKTHILSVDLPNDERYGLKSQIQRCSISLPSNIAEGSGRTTDQDFGKFIDYSLSSSYDLETQMILIDRIYQLDTEPIIADLFEFQKITGRLRSKLKI